MKKRKNKDADGVPGRKQPPSVVWEHLRCPALHPHHPNRAGACRAGGAWVLCPAVRGNRFPGVLTAGKALVWGEKPVWPVGRAAPQQNPPSRTPSSSPPRARWVGGCWNPLSPSPCHQHPSPAAPCGLASASIAGQDLAHTEHPPATLFWICTPNPPFPSPVTLGIRELTGRSPPPQPVLAASSASIINDVNVPGGG